MSTGHTPVFFDHSGKRWKRVVRYATIAAFLVSIAGAIFSFGVIVLPHTPFVTRYKESYHKFIPRFETHQEAMARYEANKEMSRLKKVIAETETDQAQG